REAVVIAREDSPGDRRLVAYLVAEAGILPEPAGLRQALAQQLADYMLPSAFVRLDALPLTPNGKLDRHALPAPDQGAVVSRDYEAPAGEIETVLAQIWQDVLGVARVGRHDHFFELGGHSLLAVQLAARVRQALAIEMPLQALFATPRLIDLAQRLSGMDKAAHTLIPVAERTERLPLSFAQQRLWFLAQFDAAASQAYHMPAALRLTGMLDRQALQRALNQLVARHEGLRTRFVVHDGQAWQQVDAPESGFALSCRDLRMLDPGLRDERLAALAAEEARAPFDLSRGPLIRAHLLQVADDEHLLLLTQHHIISDGWSIGILVREFSALYQAALRQLPDPLPPLPIQYADYAVWQRQTVQGERLNTALDFWRSQLMGAPALLDLPTDRPRPAVQSYAGAEVAVEFDAGVLHGLKACGQRHGTTLFMTLLAGWSLLLARLSGQEDVVIGTPVANRPHRELEGIIGCFVNTLALRVETGRCRTVSELLAQVRSRTLAAYAHQELPFEQVVEALQPGRSLSHSPLFQVMLALNNTPAEALEWPGLTLSVAEQPKPASPFDLTLSLTESDRGLAGSLQYASDLFEEATVVRMVGCLRTLLMAMVADPQASLSQLPMLSDAERRQLLVGFNATQAAFPQETLLHQLFEGQVGQTPDATAVVFDGQSLSYAELNARANRVAHSLISLGVQPDE
ncbi:condensation domain-containing protein, partial [Dickeya dadantii]|uniref:condensation domain-containing protein n=1 Tax=Dickeya dadantii TaxID=204038 RepID=UPI003015C8AC